MPNTYDAQADAREVAKHAFREGNKTVEAFLAFALGSLAADPEGEAWDALLAGFSLSTPAWYAAEEAIERAAGEGDVPLTLSLGRAYVERVNAYCAKWREIVLERRVSTAPAGKRGVVVAV